jgi:hypothetical protein
MLPIETKDYVHLFLLTQQVDEKRMAFAAAA